MPKPNKTSLEKRSRISNTGHINGYEL